MIDALSCRVRGLLAFAMLAAHLGVTANAAAQTDPTIGRICLSYPRPGPACSVIALTNVGGYFRIAGDGQSDFRAVADWGLLVPAGPRSAVGASVFLALDSDNLSLGPAVRYRHWSADNKSNWEAAVGLPLNDERILAHGLFKWNTSRLIGFAIRPELRRSYSLYMAPGCQVYGCQTVHKTVGVSFGVEIGGVPGLALAAATAAGLFAAVLSIKD